MKPPTRATPVAGTRAWLDSSNEWHVAICTLCDQQTGPYTTLDEAQRRAREHHHTNHHDTPGYTEARARRESPCTFNDECTRPRYAHTLCETHYRRAYRARKTA